MPCWQFFRNQLIGWIGHAMLVQPLKSNFSNWKITFVLGFYEYLERQEGKTRDGIFFMLIYKKKQCVSKDQNRVLNLKRISFWTLCLEAPQFILLFLVCNDGWRERLDWTKRDLTFHKNSKRLWKLYSTKNGKGFR